MKHFATLIFLISNTLCINAIAGELVVNEKLKDLPPNYAIDKSDTIAGVPIYTGDTSVIVEKTINDFSTGGTSALPIARLKLRHEVQTQVFALQMYSQALRPSGGTWSGDPCGSNHLVRRNNGAGREDACFTIDPVMIQLGPDNLLFFNVKVTNTSARYFQTIEFLFNARMLGFRDTGTGDWSEVAINLSPSKRKLIDHLTTWGEKFQKSALKAIRDTDLSAYSSVPNVRSLVDTPAILSDKDYSAALIGAANDILFNETKKDFKALAFTHPVSGLARFGNSWGEQTQEDADQIALRNCERVRPSSYPPCVLLSALRESASPNLQSASQTKPAAQEIPKVIEKDVIDPFKSLSPTAATSEMSAVSKAVTGVQNSQINSVQNSGVAKTQAVTGQTNPNANKEKNNSILEPKISSTNAAKSIVPISSTPPAIDNQAGQALPLIVNLKGFHTKMTLVEAKRIVSSLQLQNQRTVGGKTLATYMCGVSITPSKIPCNFTYAGMDINGIILNFWGDDVAVIRLIYLTGSDIHVDYNNPIYGAKLKEALDEKYGKQNTNSNHKGDWIFGRQRLTLEIMRDYSLGNALIGQIALVDNPTYDKLKETIMIEQENREKRASEEKKKKTLSDM